jgi:hypothetical protein
MAEEKTPYEVPTVEELGDGSPIDTAAGLSPVQTD